MKKSETVQSIVGYLNGYLDLLKEKHDRADCRNEKQKYLLMSADIEHIKEKCVEDYKELNDLRAEVSLAEEYNRFRNTEEIELERFLLGEY